MEPMAGRWSEDEKPNVDAVLVPETERHGRLVQPLSKHFLLLDQMSIFQLSCGARKLCL
jgi:hypothetical protein